MKEKDLERVRDCIRKGEYDMTVHALEEAAEDDLTVIDVESAILTGSIKRVERDAIRGVKLSLSGVAADLSTPVGVVGRLTPSDRFLVITVFEIR